MRTNRRQAYGGRSVNIQGDRFHIGVAKLKFLCLQCLSAVREVNHGLRCSKNNQHYGLILKEQAKEMTRGEIMVTMLDLFPNTSEHNLSRGGIDMVEGEKIWTIKEAFPVQRNKFQSTKRESIAILSFQETDLRVRLSQSNGQILFTAYGIPDQWKGKRVRVVDNEEKKPGTKNKTHFVTRVFPTQKAVTVDLSQLSKLELMNHCQGTLKVWATPYTAQRLGQLMACVLGQAGLSNGDFSPIPAYEEMRTTGVALHAFLSTFDDYDFALAWLIEKYKVENLAYDPEDEENIRGQIELARGEKTITEAFFDGILEEIPYFQNHSQIEDALIVLGIDEDNEQATIKLNELANSMAENLKEEEE